MATDDNYLFLVMAKWRPWRPLEGIEPPSAGLWEARAWPSGLQAGGRTYEEALDNLRDYIVAVSTFENPDFYSWYIGRYVYMDVDARAYFEMQDMKREDIEFPDGSRQSFIVIQK